MAPVLAQATEALDAARGWGEQLPALALGLAAVIVICVLFALSLRHLLDAHEKARAAAAEAHREERKERDAQFLDAIRHATAANATTAAQCHQAQRDQVDADIKLVPLLQGILAGIERQNEIGEKTVDRLDDLDRRIENNDRVLKDATHELQETRRHRAAAASTRG